MIGNIPFDELFHPVPDIGVRSKTDPVRKFLRVRTGGRHITRLHRLKILDCFTAEGLFHLLDETQ